VRARGVKQGSGTCSRVNSSVYAGGVKTEVAGWLGVCACVRVRTGGVR